MDKKYVKDQNCSFDYQEESITICNEIKVYRRLSGNFFTYEDFDLYLNDTKSIKNFIEKDIKCNFEWIDMNDIYTSGECVICEIECKYLRNKKEEKEENFP